MLVASSELRLWTVPACRLREVDDLLEGPDSVQLSRPNMQRSRLPYLESSSLMQNRWK